MTVATGDIFFASEANLFHFAADGSLILYRTLEQGGTYFNLSNIGSPPAEMAYDGTGLRVETNADVLTYDVATLTRGPAESFFSSQFSSVTANQFGSGIVSLADGRIACVAVGGSATPEVATASGSSFIGYTTSSLPGFLWGAPLKSRGNVIYTPYIDPANRSQAFVLIYDADAQTYTAQPLGTPSRLVLGAHNAADMHLVTVRIPSGGFWASWGDGSGTSQNLFISRHDDSGAVLQQWNQSDLDAAVGGSYFSSFVNGMDADDAGNLLLCTRTFNAASQATLFQLDLANTWHVLQDNINALPGVTPDGAEDSGVLIVVRLGVTVTPPLRHRQRTDGLGASVARAKQTGSQQGSLRHRGYL